MAKNDEVYVDVYPWVKEISENPLAPNIPMCGLFRHAEALSKLYTPAIIIDENESIPDEAISILEKYLDKRIRVLDDDFVLDDQLNEYLANAHSCKVWLSIAPDCSGPAVNPKKAKFKRICIVHDTMAVERTFGELNRITFEKGAKYNDAFAFVSNYARYKFITYCQHSGNYEVIEKDWIDYGAFHRYSEMPEAKPFSINPDFSLSVHGLYPHKNILQVGKIVKNRGLLHWHVGKFVNESEENILAATTCGIHFVGPLSDKMLDEQYKQSGIFICMSKEEGFSMPAMEAIINGTRTIILSDIPSHKEIYGYFSGVVFLGPDQFLSNGLLPTVSSGDRFTMFTKYHFGRISAGLQNFISGI